MKSSSVLPTRTRSLWVGSGNTQVEREMGALKKASSRTAKADARPPDDGAPSRNAQAVAGEVRARTSKIASATYNLGPLASKATTGASRPFVDTAHAELHWDRDLTRAQRLKPSSSPDVPLAKDVQAGQTQYRPQALPVRFPTAAASSIEREALISAQQILAPREATAALSHLGTSVSEAALAAGRALRPGLSIPPVDADFAASISSSLRSGGALTTRLLEIFRFNRNPDHLAIHPLSAELNKLSRGALPQARQLAVAEVAARVFHGDPNRAAAALHAIREGALAEQHLQSDARSVRDAFELAGALIEKQGMGLTALEEMMSAAGGAGSATGSKEERRDFALLKTVIEARYTGSKLEARAAAASAGPGSAERIRQERAFAEACGAAAARMLRKPHPPGSDAFVDDAKTIYGWVSGARTAEELAKLGDRLEAEFVDRMVAADDRSTKPVKAMKGLGKTLTSAVLGLGAVRTGITSLFDIDAAAASVPSAFHMIESVGFPDVNRDYAAIEQGDYDEALRKAASDAIQTLAGVPLDTIPHEGVPLHLFRIERLKDLLRQGSEERASGAAPAAGAAGAGGGRSEGTAEAPRGTAREVGQPRFDTIEHVDGRVEALIDQALDGWRPKPDAPPDAASHARKSMASLGSLGPSVLMDEALQVIRTELNLPEDAGRIEASLHEAAKLRGVNLIKAEATTVEAFAKALEALFDDIKLGNRIVERFGNVFGANQFTTSLSSTHTVTGGGPVVGFKLTVSNQIGALCGGFGGEINSGLNIRVDLQLGGVFGVDTLKFVEALHRQFSLTFQFRTEGTAVLEGLSAIALRSRREVDAGGNAFRVWRKDDDANGRKAGEKAATSGLTGEEVKKLTEDSFRHIMKHGIVKPLKDTAEGKRLKQAGQRTLFERLAVENYADGDVAIVRQNHRTDIVGGLADVAFGIVGRTPGPERAGFALAGSLGMAYDKAKLNRSDQAGPSARRVMQAEDILRGIAAIGINISLPGVPVEDNETISGVSLPGATSIGAGYSGFERGPGSSPRSFIKDGRCDVYNLYMDVPFRTLDELKAALGEQRGSWNAMLSSENIDHAISEMEAEDHQNRRYALRFHGSRALAETIDAYTTIINTLREAAGASQDPIERKRIERRIEGLTVDLAAELKDADNYVPQGIFGVEALTDRWGVGPVWGFQSAQEASKLAEHETIWEGVSNAVAVSASDEMSGLTPAKPPNTAIAAEPGIVSGADTGDDRDPAGGGMEI